MTLLELKSIKKYFQNKGGFLGKARGVTRAVDDVSLTLVKGENFGLVGESGSGKSTLARVFLRLLSSDGGKVVFNGQDITRCSSQQLQDMRRNIQVVFQDPYSSLDPRQTVRSILREPMRLDPAEFSSAAKREEKMQALLKAVGLGADVLDRYPHEFSGGERQRIAIARALAVNPKLLVLDEAVSSLDVLIQDQILKLLKQLQDEFDLTYFFISHNLRVIRRVCTTIAVMCRGKIVELAPSEELFANPLHPYTKQLLAAAMDYQPVSSEAEEIVVSPSGGLVEKGANHFVLEEQER